MLISDILLQFACKHSFSIIFKRYTCNLKWLNLTVTCWLICMIQSLIYTYFTWQFDILVLVQFSEVLSMRFTYSSYSPRSTVRRTHKRNRDQPPYLHSVLILVFTTIITWYLRSFFHNSLKSVSVYAGNRLNENKIRVLHFFAMFSFSTRLHRHTSKSSDPIINQVWVYC